MNINNLNFKKGAIIFLTFIAVNWLIHELMMHTHINQFEETVNRFNEQFNQDQALIHQRIIESEKDANRWSSAFEQKQNAFHAAVDNRLRENLDFIHQCQEKMAEQQKIFDKQFAEMPDKMWQAHLDFGERAFARFAEGSKHRDELTSKQVRIDMAKDKARRLQMYLQKEADQKAKWEAARLHYYDKNGLWLPQYENAVKKQLY